VTRLSITLFTDPACPFAFSAEPVRQRLRWHYRDGLEWTVRMIVLTREPGEAERLAEGAPGLQRRYGMPIDPRPTARPASSEPACRAVVAVRRRDPVGAERLLRALRVRVMQRGLLDDPELLAGAAADAGLDPAAVQAWSAHPDTALELESDVAAARDPSPAARALDHKLSGPAGQRRYSAPSYVIDGIAIPGFNPIEVYETVIANRAAQLARHPAPGSVAEVLRWASEPLATAEIALIVGDSIEATRRQLTEVGEFTPAGADGYWRDPD
jgi:predicted DsbA family dithiol-disulfide isomerase